MTWALLYLLVWGICVSARAALSVGLGTAHKLYVCAQVTPPHQPFVHTTSTREGKLGPYSG